MALADWKFPDPVPFIEFYNGDIMRGGYTFGFRRESNSWVNWTSKTVKTFTIADHMIEPTAPYNQETEWFEILHFPNGYKTFMRLLSQENYHFWEYELRDPDGNRVTSGVDGMSNYTGSISQAGGILFYNYEVKIAVYTSYPNEPLTGYEPNGLIVEAFLGTIGYMNLPENGTVEQCITFNQWDKLKAVHIRTILSISDIAVANNWVATHGNPVPEGSHFIGEEPLPNDYDPSRPGGGDGNYSDNSDPIDFPGLPTGGALACGAFSKVVVDVYI